MELEELIPRSDGTSPTRRRRFGQRIRRRVEFQKETIAMCPTETNTPAADLAHYYPEWLDNLADDVISEAAAMQGELRGADSVRPLINVARTIYEDQQFQFVGGYGGNGLVEEYTCKIRGEPTRVVVTIKRNAAGKTQHIVVNHRPRSSVLLFARLMGERYAGTPMAKYFITDKS